VSECEERMRGGLSCPAVRDDDENEVVDRGSERFSCGVVIAIHYACSWNVMEGVWGE
jgi:hypothetical protein